MKFSLPFVSQSVGGKTLSDVAKDFTQVTTDNRDPNIKGSLFVALVGDVHDAHKFVEKAVEAGATGVLCHQWQKQWEPLKVKASFIQVDDTLQALQKLATAWRRQLPGKVLGLTGSNGKTTTKDFLRQLIAPHAKVLASHGSYNNHWGVPLTLLGATKEDQYIVTEMGMNHGGEITRLVQIAEPDFAMVTNVGRAHMGNFANGIDGVAAAKEEIYESAPAKSQFIFNVDNKYTQNMYAKYQDRPSFTFSTKSFSADVYFRVKNQRDDGFEIEGQIGGVLGQAHIKIFGEHNIENLAAACAMAYMAGLPPEALWKNISQVNTGWGRNQWLDLKCGGRVLFDAYNANPDSFQTLLTNIKDLFKPDRKVIAVFGEMLELGDQAARAHEQLGELAGALPWEHCLFIGPSASAFAKGWVTSENPKKPMILNSYEESLDLDLASMLNNDVLYIVKGSRGGALERIVERLDPVSFPPK